MSDDITRGDYVAIMPDSTAPASEVLEIAHVLFAGNVYVQLIDGRMYATLGGHSLNGKRKTYIMPATDEHWAALRARSTALASAPP
jgi:hypothetical protein